KRATAALNSEVFAQSGFAEQDVDQLIRILGTFRRDAGDFSE
ncbi:MAG TPA: MarR family transcriptional regulator, partial [Arthrobacter sp.]|nr:MarR family transcriptional regulator [Arthrobacter sp.]